MAVNYAYNYAYIDPASKMCIEVTSTTAENTDNPFLVEIPVCDPDYMGKYYINGNWYEDAEGTIPWASSLI